VRLVAALLLAAAVAGCSSFNLSSLNPFSADRPAPKELQPIVAPISAAQVWKESIGGVEFPLVPAVNGGIVTLASSEGNVVALEAASGRPVWKTSVGAKLSAGVGSDGKVVAVVTRGGDLVALEAGQVKWKKALGARVSTAPLVAGGRVFVLGVDRSVQAFDAADGAKLWQLSRPGDALTLAQEGVIAAFKDTLVVGQGPRMAGIDPNSSTIRWEVTVGSPRGANEVERLADLVGPALRTGDLLCARSFQAAVGCVDADRGRIMWTKAIGGTDAIAGDPELMFGADASDRITSWKTPTGDVAWTSEAVMNRGVGAPGLVGASVVFGDRDGTLHWFSKAKGETQLRSTTDGNPISVPPVVVDGTLIVVTRSGSVFAFRPS
jgi:outer membrane protein assembly factor BamB